MDARLTCRRRILCRQSATVATIGAHGNQRPRAAQSATERARLVLGKHGRHTARRRQMLRCGRAREAARQVVLARMWKRAQSQCNVVTQWCLFSKNHRIGR